MLSYYYDNTNENSIFCPLHISAHYPGQMLIFLSRNAARKVSFTSHLLLLLFLQPQAAAQKFLTEWMFPSPSHVTMMTKWLLGKNFRQYRDTAAEERLLCVGRVSGSSSAVLLWQHLILIACTKSELEHSLCEKYHLLCRHPLRSVVEVRSSYHSGSFVRRLDALRGLGRRFIIVWGQEKNIWWETWADGRKHWHYD